MNNFFSKKKNQVGIAPQENAPLTQNTIQPKNTTREYGNKVQDENQVQSEGVARRNPSYNRTQIAHYSAADNKGGSTYKNRKYFAARKSRRQKPRRTRRRRRHNR